MRGLGKIEEKGYIISVKIFRVFFLLFLIGFQGVLGGYPSSLFWTTCTTSVQSPGTANFQVANYFSIIKEGRSSHLIRSHRVFPTDIGCTFGVGSWRNWTAEFGLDYLAGLNSPWFFNAKIGIDEDLLFKRAPSFSFGVFDVGTKSGVTNFNIANAVIGKKLPKSWGQTYVGAYYGNSTLGPDRAGVMIGYYKMLCPAVDCCGKEYHKLWLVADYASGRNPLGGGGAGIYYYFTPNVSLTTGPTWFNYAHTNGKWKWTIQLDVIFSCCERARY